jgi:hypothetical protein
MTPDRQIEDALYGDLSEGNLNNQNVFATMNDSQDDEESKSLHMSS